MNLKEVARILKNDGIGVMPTDTIYGLVGSAFSKRAVERIYRVRGREKNKPMIILIDSTSALKKFGIKISPRLKGFLDSVWPGPVSIIFPMKKFSHFDPAQYKYLYRGKNSLAFRVPGDYRLRSFLRISGPLVAPSANISGKPPAKNVREAQVYFGEKVDFYINGGIAKGHPSLLIEIKRF
jgi:L-threonylcarbamoyladenylate synthase